MVAQVLGLAEATQSKLIASVVSVVVLAVGRWLVLRAVHSRFEEAWVGYRASKVATYVTTVVGAAILAGVRNYFYTSPPPDTRIAMEMRRVPAKQVRHVIARGDTLSGIADRYNVSMRQLRQTNGLRNDRIRVGQVLTIPAS